MDALGKFAPRATLTLLSLSTLPNTLTVQGTKNDGSNTYICYTGNSIVTAAIFNNVTLGEVKKCSIFVSCCYGNTIQF